MLIRLCFLLAILAGSHASASVLPKQAAVASAHPLATEAGIRILESGGNAFDAAITVAAVLGVVEPYSAGIGGGGFWMLQRGKDGKTIMLDARERAPGAAHKNLYLDEQGKVDRDKATNTALAAGIPGQAAAFVHLSDHYGTLALADTLAPAIRLAAGGFPVNKVYRHLAEMRASTLRRYPASKRIFLRDGKVPDGGLIVQQGLASTLKTLAEKGFDGFYKGELAKRLVAGANAHGGIWSLEDLANYRVIEREPVRFQYADAVIWSAPPPSSGGVALAQMFGMLSLFNLDTKSSADRTHLLIEVMRRAYRDRAEYLGDPDYVDIPIARLTSAAYLDNLASSISMAHATPSSELGLPKQTGSGTHTTHFSIIDRQGNKVAATLSINLPFGSGVTVAGTGVLLNNEMDDFSAKPGSPNAYGLIGSEANAIAGGKRPLSSMTPTFMEYGPKDNRQFALIGTPGGSRIITMVFLGLLEALQQRGPQAWVDRPRFHHQFAPDVVQHETDAFDSAALADLKQRGHQLKDVGRHYGDMHAIRWYMHNGNVEAASDQRRLGKAMLGKAQ
ncbi:MAG: gamma-glutamyltransferase [Pseudomonadales bacterium]|uniref:gamma-glutamyltransferase n=1 Tax=unclassified Ketobacter TaxID=2639109 RepID=UPI000C39CC8D|nr:MULTISPECIES: gamma-glutamyltransferase [unclassified Ketobacter]MAQ23266.1 gamma-glutamyltransferase [Pseudomonadales bacterium]HBO93366.1 gamma-glutamyltransferase [Gammaproteobacteria bacterium]MBI27650.1 gamma-glutamyltransferase [Pseudomonadales bacterium]RLT90679.1 MAG: gamma-glutamyltransferase [Ketobacter sp. GenoA1]RLT99777.1 MAG: gamma-glutamyltransferase [Ketobacter sp.]|tara:strand:+ start:14138 stop:15820 length:1683 start_codon:yes stop_codon:yes gene_type:complete